ncbi:sensor histidine kinase [Heyndrickxia sp. NPDC080065]|uniref:sensor histidine kinase n=1 Tax=Heyndrickxia sp. NPDC080065 TaxID=3390568 RepID=UPI003D024971
MVISLISFTMLNFIIILGSLFYLLNIHPTFQRLLVCFLLNAFIAILAMECQDSLWLPMVLCILLSGGIFYIFSKKKNVFFHVVVINLIAILVEYLALIIVNKFKLPLLLHGLLILLTFAICLYFYKRFIHSYQNQLQLTNKLHLSLLLISIITFIVFYLNVFIPSNNGELTLSTMNFFILIVYFLIMFILSSLLLQTIRKENLVKHRETVQHYFNEYMQGLEEVNRKMYAFQHDYSNILLSMRGYIENEDIEGLRAYFHSTILKTEQQTMQKNEYFKELEKMKIVELKGLLCAKLLKAHALNISIQVEVPETIEDISVDLMDLTRILGIFLDNAIEASLLHTHPRINIAFIHTYIDDLIIVIKNKTNQQYPNIKQLFKENYSTKGDKRGYGLYNVKQLLSRYPTVSLNTYIENEWFIQEMVVKREAIR